MSKFRFSLAGLVGRLFFLATGTCGAQVVPDFVMPQARETFMRYVNWKGGEETLLFPILTDIHCGWGSDRSETYRHLGYMAETDRLFGYDFMANLGDIGLGDYNFAFTASLKAEENEAAGNMKALGYDFTKLNPADAAIPYPEINKFRTTEFTAKIRYAPGEKYMNTKQRRVKVNQDAPIFILSHTVGMKNFLGGDYNYNYTEATAYYRLWLNSWGKMELNLRAGIQWNQVPFVLLIMPEANLSFVSAPGTFSMVNNMEFLSDRYASFQMAWDMKGKIFNRVPLLRKLKLREYVGYKMMWGTLTDKNSLYLPDESYALDYKKPYMEWAVGVHNIFKILRVEYVHRMNYTDLPTAKKHGIRFFFNFTF